MFFIIKGKITLAQYFVVMIVSTICMLGVVLGSALLPHNPHYILPLMTILSVVSLGSSAKIIAATLGDKQP